MCTNKRWVYNKYIGHSLYVKCGHCPACQQEKAMRKRARLKNSYMDGYVILFVTLTYANQYVPHIKREDLLKGVNPLPVYRSEKCYYSKDSFTGSQVSLKHIQEESVLFSFNAYPYFDYVPDFSDDGNPLGLYHCQYHRDVLSLPDCTNKPGCISVIYYKDVQNFIKNLRIYSQRKLGIEKPFYSFQCAEMGPGTLRSHFHLLLYVEKRYEAWFRTAVCRCWPYADFDRTYKNIEIAFDAETYVSSYVNRGSEFPDFFTLRELRPRSSFSQGMGFCCDAFTLPHLLSAISARDLRYDKQVTVKGLPSVCSVRIPQYAINRYFPKIKGYSFLPISPSSDYYEDFIREPIKFLRYVSDSVFLFPPDSRLEYTWDDYDTTQRVLNRSRLRFNRDFEKYYGFWPSDDVFAYWYCQCQLSRSMTTLKTWYESMDSPEIIAQSYDNLDTAKIPPDLVGILYDTGMLSVKNNPNDFPINQDETKYYSDMFDTYQKRKHLNNLCYNSLYGDC